MAHQSGNLIRIAKFKARQYPEEEILACVLLRWSEQPLPAEKTTTRLVLETEAPMPWG